MLSTIEKILFSIAVLITIYFSIEATIRLIRIIDRGQGKPDWSLCLKRLFQVIGKMVTLQPTWSIRSGPTIMHALVAWGFAFYILVNIGDVLQAYIKDYHFLGTGTPGNVYRFGADILTVGVLFGMTLLIIRRFVYKPEVLTTRASTLLDPKARKGISRDSAIVGGFILLHVGFRFLGESFRIGAQESTDVWQPFASIVSSLWGGWNPTAIDVAIHVSFWVALGLIFAFIPYFPYSKHIHLFFAPLNYLLKPERRSIGELSSFDFEDESIEQFGVAYIEELGWEQIMDAYACIMCHRCQEVCPAYATGKALSPSALEINKRYFLNYEGNRLVSGETSTKTLIEFAISEEAIWACTTCGACVSICPVGNEPMRDILDIRRFQVLMENSFPSQLQTAFRGMERTMNPWNIPPNERTKWTEGLDVPTIEENPDPDYLWWVGCAASTDARAQKAARALAEILNAAGINYAILGEKETCTGDSARRAGNDYLFYELAMGNIALFNHISPKKILTSCPHCLHTIKNEYPAYGGEYEVVHHTELLNQLISNGHVHLHHDAAGHPLTYHDPCYLGRHNDIYQDPRLALRQTGSQLIEMDRTKLTSFCCGAGGAQMWKEEEHGNEAVNIQRLKEAQETGASSLAVGCPFCMIMLSDAVNDINSQLQVLDVAEVILAQMSSDH